MNREPPSIRTHIAVASLAGLLVRFALPGYGDSLIQRAMQQENRIAYEGKRVSASWDQSRTLGATVTHEYCDGHGRCRIVYLAPRKLKGHVLVNDGKIQWDRLPRRHCIFKSSTSAPPSADIRWGLLRLNYTIESPSQPQPSSHLPSTEFILRPKVAGKPLRKIWIELRTGLILRVERYHPDQSLAAVSNFLTLNLHPQLSPALFEMRPMRHERIVEHKPDAVFSSTGSVAKVVKGYVPLPVRLFGNYVFAEATVTRKSPTQRQVTLHYTDGLSVLTLVENLENPSHNFTLPHAQRFRESRAQFDVGTRGHLPVVHWASNHAHFMLVGDVSQDLIRRIASDLASQIPPGATPARIPHRLLLAAKIFIFLLLATSAASLLQAYYRRRATLHKPSRSRS